MFLGFQNKEYFGGMNEDFVGISFGSSKTALVFGVISLHFRVLS